MHRVVKPFPFSENGFTLVDLNVDDERDFGSMADGLVAEGWIAPVGTKKEAPVEFAVESKPTSARKGR